MVTLDHAGKFSLDSRATSLVYLIHISSIKQYAITTLPTEPIASSQPNSQLSTVGTSTATAVRCRCYWTSGQSEEGRHPDLPTLKARSPVTVFKTFAVLLGEIGKVDNVAYNSTFAYLVYGTFDTNRPSH